jgi:two-component system chemotaxis response regulator CheY
MRKILRQKIMANLNDTEVFVAKDAADADAILSQNPCQLIIQTWHYAEKGALPFLRKLRDNQEFADIPFLLLSADRNEEQIRLLLEAGASECLYLPSSARTLTETINRICNPVSLRKSKRYSFSAASTCLAQRQNCFDGKIINISMGGMLCELDWSNEFQCGVPLMAQVEVTLGEETIVITDLYARMANLRLIGLNPDHTFRRVRIALAFIQVSDDSRAGLERVFRLAEQEENECVNSR